jgi:general secretion pathway protein N
VTRGRMVLYCAVGAIAYLIALAATVPATWISHAIERASSERLLVRSPVGTVWAGSARVYARERTGPPLELGELRWTTKWTALFTGKLVTDVALGSAARPVHLELSPFGLSLQGMDVTLPAQVLGSFAPGLETFGPEGVLRVRSGGLRVENGSFLGQAEVEWRQVRFARAPGLRLGSHVARVRGSGNKVDIELGTLEGPLRLSGTGTWDPKSGLRIAGAVEHSAQGPPELVRFLQAVCTGYRNNQCVFRMAL